VNSAIQDLKKEGLNFAPNALYALSNLAHQFEEKEEEKEEEKKTKKTSEPTQQQQQLASQDMDMN